MTVSPTARRRGRLPLHPVHLLLAAGGLPGPGCCHLFRLRPAVGGRSELPVLRLQRRGQVGQQLGTAAAGRVRGAVGTARRVRRLRAAVVACGGAREVIFDFKS